MTQSAVFEVLAVATVMLLAVQVVRAGSDIDIIPTPRQCVRGQGTVRVISPSIRPAVITAKSCHPKEALARLWIIREIKRRTGIDCGSTPPAEAGMRIELATAPAGMEGLGALDRQALADNDRTGQAYILIAEGNRIRIVGSTPQGTLYGAMTLLQLLKPGRDGLTVPACRIRDWPDFKWREGVSWEMRGHGKLAHVYDWCDGVENFVRRCKKDLDWCLRYKINAINVEFDWGPAFHLPDKTRWRGATRVYRDLCRYARARGVHLFFCGFGNGGLKNRRPWPNGPEYNCVGHHRSEKGETRGFCASNNALMKARCKILHEFVREVEPGGMYMHLVDTARYDHARQVWGFRCPRCRKRWPNDDPKALDGSAGASAHMMNEMCRAMFSVKKPRADYDAARDFVFAVVFAPYSALNQDDRDWDQCLGFYRNVSGAMDFGGDNVQFLVRELAHRQDSPTLRVQELADMLARRGKGPGVYLHLVEGAFYTKNPVLGVGHNRMFVGTTSLAWLWKGAKTLWGTDGKYYQRALQAMHAEYFWNTRGSGWRPRPKTRAGAKRRYMSLLLEKERPEQLYGPTGFIERACRRLYGPAAGRCMARATRARIWDKDGFDCTPLANFLLLIEEKRGFPVMGRAPREMLGRWRRYWRGCVKATDTAIENVTKALVCDDFNEDLREETRWFLRNLQVGRRYAEILISVAQVLSTNDPARARRIADAVRQKLTEQRTFIVKTLGDPRKVLHESASDVVWAWRCADRIEQMLPAAK